MLGSQDIRTKIDRATSYYGEKYQEPIFKLESSDVLQVVTHDIQPVDSVSTGTGA